MALDVSGSVNVGTNVVVGNPYFFYTDLYNASSSVSTNIAASGGSALIPFTTNTTIFNRASQSGFNNATNAYTIPIGGLWQFNVSIHLWGSTVTGNQNGYAVLYRNGSKIDPTQTWFGLASGFDICCAFAPVLLCAANDVISVYVFNNGGSILYRDIYSTSRLSYFYGQLICSP